MNDIRPDWRTILRRFDVPDALALGGGKCSHGREAEQHEPIVLLGAEVVREPDGSMHVDLTGAEWHPQQCLA